jgi:hypothetical protein
LDLFTDPQFEDQIHDLNPGIADSGLFWTIPLREDAVDVELDDEVDINHHRLHQHPEPTSSAATMQVRNEALDDYHDFVNAFRRGAEGACDRLV